jgi:hypothetical protein
MTMTPCPISGLLQAVDWSQDEVPLPDRMARIKNILRQDLQDVQDYQNELLVLGLSSLDPIPLIMFILSNDFLESS